MDLNETKAVEAKIQEPIGNNILEDAFNASDSSIKSYGRTPYT